MRFVVSGGGWVSSAGWGRAGAGYPGAPDGSPALLPKGSEVFARPPARFGRFDTYTRAGLSAIALALDDAGRRDFARKQPLGLLASSLSGCLAVDLAFQESCAEAGGAFASPNLFSYTLPGIVLGEAALHFGLTGPSMALGDTPGRPGRAALETGLELLAARACPALLAGWIEAGTDAPMGDGDCDTAPRGSLFVLLERADGAGEKPGLQLASEGPALDNGSPVADLPTLFDTLWKQS